MRSNPYLLQGLKYATFTIAGVILVIAGGVLMRQANLSNLGGFVLISKQSGVLPTIHFDQNRVAQGFTAPADTHAIFTIPEGVRIPRITFFGGPDYDQNTRYWGYCFSGNEAANKAAGMIGKAMYDGKFFYSLAERKAQSELPPAPADTDLIGIKNGLHGAAPAPASIAEIFFGGDTCYVMSERELPSGLDTDGDGINDKRELLLGTDVHNPDTDHDGIPDGTEVFVTKTSPLDPDTDHDGLPDGLEDKNHNGIVDPGETSPLNPDTDRDGLCDGNGLAPGCPEQHKTVCTVDAQGQRTCSVQASSPVYGEDMNENGIVDNGETDPTKPNTYGIDDWDYKWNFFQAQNGNRKIKRGPGVDAPDFPIPSLPMETP